MLMSGLWKYVSAIQRIDDGYALRFHWSDDLGDRDNLIEEIANDIIFESRNSPQLTYSIVEERQAKAFWLQVRELKTENHDVRLPPMV
jgi:hypothetical protein